MDKCSYIVIKTGFSCSSSSLFILLICKRDDFFIYEYRETTNSNRKYFYWRMSWKIETCLVGSLHSDG